MNRPDTDVCQSRSEAVNLARNGLFGAARCGTFVKQKGKEFMETQLNLFNEGLTGTIPGASVLNKAILKERIKNTHLQAANPLFIINKWETADERLELYYCVAKTSIGELLIAATSKGITYTGFIVNDLAKTIDDLKRRFPKNMIAEKTNNWIHIAITRINNPASEQPLQLHLKGTDYQLAVWEKLILIPFGGVTNYKQLGNGAADARAIGAAVGANPIGFLVPCHRVIRADGSYDGFFWGNKIKAGLLTYEATVDALAI